MQVHASFSVSALALAYACRNCERLCAQLLHEDDGSGGGGEPTPAQNGRSTASTQAGGRAGSANAAAQTVTSGGAAPMRPLTGTDSGVAAMASRPESEPGLQPLTPRQGAGGATDGAAGGAAGGGPADPEPAAGGQPEAHGGSAVETTAEAAGPPASGAASVAASVTAGNSNAGDDDMASASASMSQTSASDDVSALRFLVFHICCISCGCRVSGFLLHAACFLLPRDVHIPGVRQRRRVHLCYQPSTCLASFVLKSSPDP